MSDVGRGDPSKGRPRQLAFDWPFEPDLARARFVEGAANADALGAVDAWRNWPGGVFLLVGDPGSGKTHLAHIWACDAGARRFHSDTLPEALEELGPGGRAVLELPAAPGVEERPLLHLLNHIRQIEGSLLLTARTPPSNWSIALPDLRSRLSALSFAWLSNPDETLLVAVLGKHLLDRGVRAERDVLEFLAFRMERSYAAASRMADRLERLQAERQSAITRALAQAALDAE